MRISDWSSDVCSSDLGSCGPVLREARDQARVKDPDVIRAIGIMEARIESVSSISEIAQSAEISKRTLERKFRQVLNRTPSQAYLQCRLEHATRLLRNPHMQIREVAAASGLP